MPDQTNEPTFWQAVWIWIKRVARWVLAPLPAILLVAGAIILVAFGSKNVQIGGILGKLFGRETPDNKALDKANTIPEHRVDKDGQLIPVGQPDSKGITQAQVVPIQPTGLFSNPDHVQIIPPGETKPISVQLPDGVKSKDVDKVVVINNKPIVVTVTDKSGIPAESIDRLIEKYGG